ncbi:putative membrane protein (TIGR02226 family) [Lacinutrix venerupis]|uniref:BatA domain-containing protein n=1 Tax=Lacinutrix venerupis TaxID=1486034 RepID=UPI000EABA74E|nr:BatA domain-containing protein [Lacinutrix venerupis]RLJ60923.1 putative membrane protein (TIGR02226 family) [Lacinutrix venerupis]
MQFKHPELLYALLLLLIPIIVHLFQLRKFQKEAFTNVAFLKKVTLQTRKSAQIKKWLTLFTRMGILAAIVIAFTQPFTSKNNTFNTTSETVIYLDNSFSMQAKGSKGELLKRAVSDIISSIPEDENISLITNDNSFRNTTVKAITNDLLNLNYSTNQLPYDAALLKSKKFFSKKTETIKNLVFISDFQQKETNFSIKKDENTTLNLVQLKPVNNSNVTIDTVYISKKTSSNLELTVSIKNNGNAIENLPVSLYNNGNLLTKSSVKITDKATTVFTLPANESINGKVVIDDVNLQFDNALFFNINNNSKINVLAINESSDTFLKNIYTEKEFNYKSTAFNQLSYGDISNQNLIILNELKNIPNSLVTALKAFTSNNGVIVVIPSQDIDIESYNNLLLNYNFGSFSTSSKIEKRLTTINYSHPIYSNGVFEKRVSNFQYPKINSYYPQLLGKASPVLQFEDGKPFLSEHNNAFVFSSALNKENSNFQDINLIVPTFYNISKRSLQISNLYYTIGIENTFDVVTNLQQDAVLTLENNNAKVIPQQQYFNNKVTITTNETPEKAGIYNIKNDVEIVEGISYNYNRNESNLVYQNFSNIDNLKVSNSISEVFNSIKNDTKVNELWKWFVILALILLVFEMLILKYFK